MKKLIFIKLGGSLITEKDKPMTARLDIIEQLAADIASLIKQMPEYTFIIGNGAGSFGHYQVVKYGLKEGVSSPEQWQGVSEVQSAASELNRIVVNALLKQNIPVYKLQPSAMFTAENSRLSTSNLEGLNNALQTGLVISVYGDIILDSKKGCTIFSTEKVFDILLNEALQKGNSVKAVVHLSKVPGVQDSNGQIIPLITKENWNEIQHHISSTEGFDVTGGMKHKIESSLEYAEKGIVTYIGSGETKNILQKILLNNDTTGLTMVSD